jgi:polysaccharide export outer membrane protein
MYRNIVLSQQNFNLTFMFLAIMLSCSGCSYFGIQNPTIGAKEIAESLQQTNISTSAVDKSLTISPGDVVEIIYFNSYDKTEPYRLSADDKIYVNVYDHPEYSKEVSVLPDGTISIPKTGVVSAAGLGIQQLERNITAILAKDMREPLVNVMVVEAQKKLDDFLESLANSSSERTFRAEISSDGMIDLPAVGEIPVAGLTIKETEKKIINYYNKIFTNLTVHLKLIDSQKFQLVVVGEVAKPGVYPLSGRVDPLHALALAGGAQVTAGLSEVYILRTNKAGKVEKLVVNLDGEETLQPNRENNIYVQGGDLVFVPMSGIAYADLIVDQYIKRIIPGRLSAGAYWNFNNIANNPAVTTTQQVK